LNILKSEHLYADENTTLHVNVKEHTVYMI